MFYVKVNKYRLDKATDEGPWEVILVEDQSTMLEVRSYSITTHRDDPGIKNLQVHYTEPKGVGYGSTQLGSVVLETLVLGMREHSVFVMNPVGKTIARYPWAQDAYRDEIIEA